MTYLLFLLIFVVVPGALLALALRRQLTRAYWAALGIVIFIAVLYTTPWDNYLVASGVWSYDPKLVLNITLGRVPIEEYAFFVVQTIFTGLVLRAVLKVLSPESRVESPEPSASAAGPRLNTPDSRL